MKNKVLIIQNKQIRDLNIPPLECVEWVDESFCLKYDAQLPAKISVHPHGNDFFTSMPCLLPPSYGMFGIKEVSRVNGRTPSLSSDILLYDSMSGALLALMDGDWITAMRTGAVAALSIKTLQKTDANSYSFIGLGNTARATALCLLSIFKDRQIKFQLLKYKNQAEAFIRRFENYSNVEFEIVNSVEDLVSQAEVLISCITDAQGLLCPDESLWPEGILLVPVHTRGFQNCDLFFDKIYGDDRGHICGFGNFNKFKEFDEFSNVLMKKNPGRVNDRERILVYNIGLGLHDIIYAYKIYSMLKNEVSEFFIQEKETERIWMYVSDEYNSTDKKS